MRCIFLGSFLACLSFATPASQLALTQVLSELPDSASVRASGSDLQALDALRERRESEAGWQWFASGSAGRYRELVTDEIRSDYVGHSLAIGLRHPLLGTLRRQLRAVDEVASDRVQQKARQQLERAEHRLMVSSAYIDWWRATEAVRWCAPVAIQAEQARREISERARGGWLLPSDSRQLDSRWRTLADDCGYEQQSLRSAKFALERLTLRDLNATHPVSQSLPLSILSSYAWIDRLDLHPRLQARKEQVRLAESTQNEPWHASIDSSFAIAQSYEGRQGARQPGNALIASLSFSAPFDPMSYGAAGSREGAARFHASQARLEVEREALSYELSRSLDAQNNSMRILAQAKDRMDISAQALREQRLRHGTDVDQSFSSLHDAEVEHRRAGLDLINRWHGAWSQALVLQVFVDDEAARHSLLGTAFEDWEPPMNHGQAAESKTPWQQGAYIWDSRPLLDPHRRSGELAKLKRAGFRRLYIGLSGAQLKHAEITSVLMQTVTQVSGEGLEAVLLLGDPDWMSPAHRHSLLALIGDLKVVPFAGLHLDLEIEQRGWPVPAQHVRDLIDTLKEVAAASPWPVEISSHHRWFTEEMGGVACVPCELPSLGVSQASLMIYTRSPERSAQLAEQIAKRWPAMRFRLAQSVEPQLAPEETWSGLSRAKLKNQESLWRDRLQPHGVEGIDWQAWEYFPQEHKQ